MRPFTLQSVTFVLHQQPYADVLDQVGGLIAQYLGPRANLSLSDACRFQSTVLLDWIWASSCVSIASRPTHWSLDNYLRSDEFYNRWEFVESVKVAVTLDNVRTLQWLFRHFKGCVVLSDVVIMAAEKGSMPVLEFLLANDSTEGNKVQWGAASVQQALRCGHLDVAHWLYKHTPQTDTTEEQHEWTIKDAMDAGDIEFCQSLLPKGACILDYTRYCDIPEMIEWKLDCGYLKRDKKSAAVAIRDLAVTGHLDLIKRIASEHLNLPPQDRIESHRWGEALKEACKTDNLSVVKWLLEHPTGRQAVHTMKSTNSLSKLLSHSAEKGNVDVMQYLYEQGAVDKFGNALLDAIRTNQMGAVEWLLQHLPDSEPIPDFAVMHEAARRGHVGCTVRAIEQALSFGFLKVACWLRQQHPELAPASVTLPSPTEVFGVLLFLSAEYPDLLTTEFARSARDDVSGRFATANDVPISEWLRRNYPVPDVAEEQRERHFAERIAGNIAQQIARQLGGAARVHVVGGQQGGGHDDALGMLMNNFIMVAHDSDDDDVSSSEEEDDDSNSEDDDE
ncbi:uncharacterized protein PITG_05272 [Phytophthora infestans T30-4]|uniref:Uncharacterized protein n=1 Tax=Phytophthora infestans (strain T30-4) TaxID=403677 RepID=D0N3Y5_PHYIT|nr:uncharacterized protein PITG_05272 [Phytophthora infestans T30-4]EEY69089.1 conserved hypothetical protein [Phytophthora infestans T30-4]|eukprot:XP_002998943.1 conserved hypothetical protein [Phytophthora infestans T30-4]